MSKPVGPIEALVTRFLSAIQMTLSMRFAQLSTGPMRPVL